MRPAFYGPLVDVEPHRWADRHFDQPDDWTPRPSRPVDWAHGVPAHTSAPDGAPWECATNCPHPDHAKDR